MTCTFCGTPGTHYMTHMCPGCECPATSVRIPGEPHIPSYLDMEWNPDCPVHASLCSELLMENVADAVWEEGDEE
jgi:hypothetical protein